MPVRRGVCRSIPATTGQMTCSVAGFIALNDISLCLILSFVDTCSLDLLGGVDARNKFIVDEQACGYTYGFVVVEVYCNELRHCEDGGRA